MGSIAPQPPYGNRPNLEPGQREFTGHGGATILLNDIPGRDDIAVEIASASREEQAVIVLPPDESHNAGQKLRDFLDDKNLSSGDRVELDSLAVTDLGSDLHYYHALDVSYFALGDEEGFMLAYVGWGKDSGQRTCAWTTRDTAEGIAAALLRDEGRPDKLRNMAEGLPT